MIVFQTTDRKTNGSAMISPEGKYFMQNAPVGEVQMAVETASFETLPPEPVEGQAQTEGEPKMIKMLPARRNPLYTPTPAKYTSLETSGLRAVIPSPIGDDVHTHNIELTTK